MLFTKMQGLGNDYIYVNVMENKIRNPQKLARRMSDRHFGIGSDGLILIGASQVADVKMQMFNADGSQGKMCGNGIRCVAKYVYEKEIVPKKKIKIETLSGIKETEILTNGCVRVNMGKPKILKMHQKVPLKQKQQDMDCISIGNLHGVIYMEELHRLKLEKIGPKLEQCCKKERMNVEFIKILDRKHLAMRVWERGSGETMACGTGACAAVVSSIARDLTEREVLVELKGGNLQIIWRNEDIYMTGPAVTVFEGSID